MSAWKPISDPNAGFAFSLSDALATLLHQHPQAMHSVRQGDMWIGSDYSGQHKNSTHEAYSFVVTSTTEIIQWEAKWKAFRLRCMSDGRRMSYKQLRDSVRWNALPDFLECAFSLRGSVLTFMISKHINSFVEGGITSLIRDMPECFPTGAKPHTAEKMYVISTLIAMIIAGMRAEDQISWWVSDDDEILDTNQKREGVAKLASYITFGFTGWRNPADSRFGTTGDSFAPLWADDLAAIPDLMAGTFCSLSAILPPFYQEKHWTRSIPATNDGDYRAKAICEWLQERQRNMSQVLVRLESSETGNISASAQSFLRSTRNA